MKKRALITILLAFLLVAPYVDNVQATSLQINPVDVNIETGVITISGTESYANKSMSLLVLNPNAVLGDLVANPEDIQNQREVFSDSNKNFSYPFELYLDGVEDTGDYAVYINGELVDTFYYAIDTDRNAIIQGIIDSTDSQLTTLLNNENTLKSFSVNKFRPLLLVDKAKLSATVNPLIKAMDLSVGNNGVGSVIQSILKQCAVLELYNQGINNECYDGNGQFNYNDILNIDGLDSKYTVTLYGCYSNLLTENGKSVIRNSLFNNGYNNLTEFSKDFLQQVVLKGIKNPKLIGYGHISSLLSAQNMSFLGLTGNITDDVARKLVEYQGEYTSSAVLQQKINEFSTVIISNPHNDNNNHTTYGGSFSVTTGANIPTPTPTPTIQSTVVFDDIDGVDWAKTPIEYLYSKGAVSGVGDNKFDPDNLVTREQFVKMICIALGIKGESNQTFTDVESDSWYAPYVIKGVGAGIIKGIGYNEFGTGTPITRQDVAVMIYRTMEKTSTEILPLEDINQVDDYAVDAVNTLRSMKIINGFEDNTFRPRENCTRAQAATIIYNFLNANSKIEE